MRFRLSFLAVLLAFAVPATAQNTQGPAARNRTADVQTAFTPAEYLRQGINASQWFAPSGDSSPKFTDSYADGADIALMAKMGFDHVRLGIDPAALAASMNAFKGPNNDFLPRPDHAVDTMPGDVSLPRRIRHRDQAGRTAPSDGRIGGQGAEAEVSSGLTEPAIGTPDHQAAQFTFFVVCRTDRGTVRGGRACDPTRDGALAANLRRRADQRFQRGKSARGRFFPS